MSPRSRAGILLSVLPSDPTKNAPKFWDNLNVEYTGASLLHGKQELSISSDLTRATYKNSLDKPRRVEGTFDVAGKLTLGRIAIDTPNDNAPVYGAITTAKANLPKERADAEKKLVEFRKSVAALQVYFQGYVRNNGKLLFPKQSSYEANFGLRDRTDLEAWCIGAFVIIGQTFTPARQQNQRTYTWFWIEGAGAEAEQWAADYFSEARNCASP